MTDVRARYVEAPKTNWAALILELRHVHRMTYREISEKVGAHHSTIERLAYADTSDPSHSLGERLLKLSAEMRQETAV